MNHLDEFLCPYHVVVQGDHVLSICDECGGTLVVGHAIDEDHLPSCVWLAGLRRKLGYIEIDPPVGKKFDGEGSGGEKKVRTDLLPIPPLLSVARVLQHGADKYGSDDNWKAVEHGRRRYYAAALRHLFAWWCGEKTDPETGESHLSHLICCALFLWQMDASGEAK